MQAAVDYVQAIDNGYGSCAGNRQLRRQPAVRQSRPEVKPTEFLPSTEPKVVDAFNRVDRDRDGFIDDKELQCALRGLSHNLNLRTTRLLLYCFTRCSATKIGRKEYASLYHCLQHWRAVFTKQDKNRNGRMEANELRQAFQSLHGQAVPTCVLNLLISKFDCSASLDYDSFIQHCMAVKGLTDKFRMKQECGGNSTTFTYEEFLMNVLPFVIA